MAKKDFFEISGDELKNVNGGIGTKTVYSVRWGEFFSCSRNGHYYEVNENRENLDYLDSVRCMVYSGVRDTPIGRIMSEMGVRNILISELIEECEPCEKPDVQIVSNDIHVF